MKYEDILAFTLKYEGGKVDDKTDPGGRTAYGVTKATYNDYLAAKGLHSQDVWQITQAEVKDIYYNLYWLAAKCDKITDIKLAASVFDFAVNCGVSRSLRYLAICNNDYKLFNRNRQQYYNKLVMQKPALKKYSNGWSNRVIALERLLA